MNKIERGSRRWITEGKVNEDTRDTLMQSRQNLFKESYKDILPDSWEQTEERTVKLHNDECFPVPTYAPTVGAISAETIQGTMWNSSEVPLAFATP